MSQAQGEDDDALIERIAAGDRQAFAALMERHIDRAFRLARRMTGNHSEADDVVQEAFIRVWTKAEGWQPGRAQFSTWLYRVVVNLCVDAGRRKGRTVNHDLDAAAELPDPSPSAEATIAVDQRAARVRAAVAELPERQRAAVVLTYTEGLSNAEAAAALQISVGALESLLVRARRDLRDRLAGLVVAEGEAT